MYISPVGAGAVEELGSGISKEKRAGNYYDLSHSKLPETFQQLRALRFGELPYWWARFRSSRQSSLAV